MEGLIHGGAYFRNLRYWSQFRGPKWLAKNGPFDEKLDIFRTIFHPGTLSDVLVKQEKVHLYQRNESACGVIVKGVRY